MMMMISKTCSYILAPLFFITLLSVKLSYCSILIACPEIEKQSLLNFKQSLKDPHNFLSSWNDNEVSCCKWGGVFCSNLTGHILEIDLHNSNLSGKINPSLLNLKHLKYLDLSQNNFEEKIPSFIGSLANLEYLDLSYAGFYGKIPYAIGNLSSLHTLILEGILDYESVLHIDTLEWLSGIFKLEYLNMNSVNLSRASNKWPEQVINKLPSLVELHFSHCSLYDFTELWNGNVNISHSNLAILDLSSNYFEGPIPPMMANTTKLKHIDLSLNYFNSSIPDWLYSFKDLEYVDLGSNHLKKSISISIANLSSLNTLDLSDNGISGRIPREIANLCKLQKLELSQNKLEGKVSISFGNMSDCFLGSLESLYLAGNQLSGHLTHQFGEFKVLKSLDLGGNSLSGVIPNNIGNLSSLEFLYLDNGNKLSGILPESMGQQFNMKGIFISGNMLKGVVTETHFARLSKLEYLLASGNHLTLRVRPNWIPPFTLMSLGLGSWNLGPGSSGFPPWLETQKKNISALGLSCTGISGKVPDWIWNIQYFNLSHNKLRGNIPLLRNTVVNGTETQDRFAYLSSNNFSGSLPRVGNNVAELDLSNNSFSGDISHFLCHSSNVSYKLRILHLGGNLLSGQLPDCWMYWPSLKVLNLGNNNFFGTIPNSIGFLSNLQSLNLYGNKLSGRIPLSIQNCMELVKLDLSNNAFDGCMPNWIETSFSKLKFLILRSNRLSGDITLALCQLSSLQILDLANNTFSGMIPRCIQNFNAMATKRSLPGPNDLWDRMEYSSYPMAFRESASIATKGSELNYDTTLALVTSIDLSNNNLTGKIPNEIASLVELISLNLSANHLTGLIPDGIGNMKQLESLDFSRNSLSGDIPSSFTSMTSLSYLNLSHNNLSGKIPESTQIQILENSSFVGNNLCGPPLTISCNKVFGPSTHGEDQDEKGNKPEIVWLYVFVSLGYAVGLSGFLTTLYLKKAWRDAYYQFFEDMWYTVFVYLYIRWTKFIRALIGRNL